MKEQFFFMVDMNKNGVCYIINKNVNESVKIIHIRLKVKIIIQIDK